MDPGPEQVAVARALVAYLQAHPLASDSVEGIHRWWLGSPPVSLAALNRVLDWMRTHEVIEEVLAGDGRLRYRRCASDRHLRRVVGQLDAGEGGLH